MSVLKIEAAPIDSARGEMLELSSPIFSSSKLTLTMWWSSLLTVLPGGAEIGRKRVLIRLDSIGAAINTYVYLSSSSSNADRPCLETALASNSH